MSSFDLPHQGSRAGWSFAAAAILAVTTAFVIMRPGVGYDPARGLLASEQRLRGGANTLSELSLADPVDLSRDRLQPISWWPPGQQMVVYALRRTGVSLGGALKTLGLASWGVGMLAWSVYFATALADKRLLPWLVGAFALLRASHWAAYEYTGGDTLLWPLFPIVALLLLRAFRADSGATKFAAAAGALAGLLGLIKYTALILLVGWIAGVGWFVARRMTRQALPIAAAFMAGAALGLIVAFVGAAQALAGPTPAASITAHSWWTVLAECAAGPLFAIADVSAVVLSISIWGDLASPADATIGLVALGLAALFVWWLLESRRSIGAPEAHAGARRFVLPLGLAMTTVTSAALAILLWRGGQISWEGRHQQYGAFLLLPILVDAFRRAWTGTRGRARALTAMCCLVLIATPVAYGAIALARHAYRNVLLRSSYTSDGLQLYWTGEGQGAEAFERELAALPWFRQALIATPVVTVALAFPDHRALLVMDSERWEEERYQGRPQGAVALLAPPWFAAEGVALIRAKFENISTWERIDLKSVPTAQLWRGQ